MSELLHNAMPSPLGEILLETDGMAITKIHFCNETLNVINNNHPLLLQAKEELEKFFAGDLHSFCFPMAQSGT